MQEYKATFNLANAAGQLVTTIGTMNPARRYNGGAMALSPRRGLLAATMTATGGLTQTFTVSVVDVDGVARVFSVAALAAATDAAFEPEHDVWIGAGEHFQVDLTATGSPAVTGVLTIFTDEA